MERSVKGDSIYWQSTEIRIFVQNSSALIFFVQNRSALIFFIQKNSGIKSIFIRITYEFQYLEIFCNIGFFVWKYSGITFYLSGRVWHTICLSGSFVGYQFFHSEDMIRFALFESSGIYAFLSGKIVQDIMNISCIVTKIVHIFTFLCPKECQIFLPLLYFH